MTRSAKIAWVVSAALHAVILGLAARGVSAPERMKIAEPQRVAVEIISAAALTQMKGGDREAKADAKSKSASRQEAPKEAAPRPAREKSASARAHAPGPRPKPNPPKSQAKPASKPSQRKFRKLYTERLPRATPPKFADERMKEADHITHAFERPTRSETAPVDSGRMAALLDKDPSADARVRAPGRPPGTLEEQARGLSPGDSARMTISEIDAFRAQISRCWTPPIGGLAGNAAIVRLRLTFNPDGTLARPPLVLDSASSPIFRAAADSAVRAVLRCQPYRLPEQKFATWRDMILNFDPRHMLGG